VPTIQARKSDCITRFRWLLDHETLAISGWCVVDSTASTEGDLSEDIRDIAEQIGEIVPGRGRQLVERIIPYKAETSYAGSLSSAYGLAPLPLHMDTAHWPIPCRYLVMACVAVGPTPTPTVLLDSRRIQMSEPEATVLNNAVFLVRNGRQSFYGSIRSSDRSFLRVDPGCMYPLSPDGEIALSLFRADRHVDICYCHDWKVGQILILDNWRILHGRGLSEQTEPGRILLRAMVK